MFLKNKNIIFKIRRSQVTDYAALNIFKAAVNEPVVEPVVDPCGVAGPVFPLYV